MSAASGHGEGPGSARTGSAARARGVPVGREPEGDDADGGGEPWGLAWKWVKRASVTAVGISVIVHIVGLFASGMYVFGWPTLAGDGGGGGEVEVVFAGQGELDKMGEATLDLGGPAVPEMTASEPVASDLLETPMSDGAGSSDGEIGDVGSLAGGGDIGAGGGEGLGGGGGGGGASFFGVEARGNRFAYIVDVSGSMEFADKISALRRALTESIGGLTDSSEFLIVPFSTGAQPLGNRRDWTGATIAGKRWAKTNIEILRPEGGTEPMAAFDIVLKMRPKPDAIYFMTDGEFAEGIPDEIALLNAKLKVPIHCICFASREGEEAMRKIAKQSKGTFTFVPGPK